MKKKNPHLENIKPGINKISKYVSGDIKNSNRNVAKLSSNESPFELPKRIVNDIFKRLRFSNKYPDGDSSILKKAIANNFGLKRDQIVCGNGSDDILSLICLAFSRENSEIICSNNGFLFYPIIAYSSGAKPVYADTKDYSISLSNIINKITSKTRIIFFSNPNNPTGSIISKTNLVSALSKIPKNIIVVIDGAYAEYVQEKNFSDGLELVKKFPNLVITRTFSKIYSLAAFRVGWGYSSKATIEILEKIRGPFNVNLVAQLAASQILTEKAFINRSIKHNIKCRNEMSKNLKSLGFSVFESHGNFLLVKNNFKDFSTRDIINNLAKKNVFVRSLKAYNLSKCFRVSIGTIQENNLFLKEIANLVKKNV